MDASPLHLPPPFAIHVEQARQFYTLSSNFISPRDEPHQYQAVLARLQAAANAEVGALMVLDERQRRFVFRAAAGLNCPESSICSLVWSYGKQLLNEKNDLTNGFTLKREEMQRLPEFNFEKLLGFKSLCFHPLTVDGRLLGGGLLGNRRERIDFSTRDLRRLAAAALIAGSDLERLRLHQELKNAFVNSVRAFVSAIDAKDPYTHGHSERVTDYAVKMARVLNWPEEQIDALQMAAILHDVGKIGVSEQILSKPSRLTAEEFIQIQRHPEIGARIIGEIPQLDHALSGILCHHERYDGRGYPNRLGSEDIPIFGRLIAVADAYDAMTSDRPYRKGLNVDDSLQEIVANSGKQFDPLMVSAFMESYKRGAIV